jgi:outer membrane protein insertion porin family
MGLRVLLTRPTRAKSLATRQQHCNLPLRAAGGAFRSRRWHTRCAAFLRRLSPAVTGALALALQFPAHTATAADVAYWGRPVIRMRLVCDAPLSLDDFSEQVTQKVGDPLDGTKVQQTIKNLFATGRFRDLRADVEDVDSGVELTLVARAAYFVGIVRVEGVREPLDPGVLVTSSRLRLGQRFEEEDLTAARERLRSALRNNAYYEASIDYRVTPHPEIQAADIVFSVALGERARLSSVEFHGDLTVPIQKLTSTSGWKAGSHLTSTRLERGLYRIHQMYLKLGHPQAIVTVLSREFDPQKNTEKLAVQIEAGPQVLVRVEGAKISSSKLREILPFYREGSLDEAGVARGADILRDYFERQGFFQAKVEGQLNSSENPRTVDISYRVQLGGAGKFVGYEFRGNESISEEDLRSVMTIYPSAFWRERGLFSHELLKADVRTLQLLYQNRGFPNAEIRADVATNYESRQNDLFVTLHVNEHAKATVNRLELIGIDRQAVNELWPSLICKPGQAYSPPAARADRETILRYFADRGFPSAIVELETAPGPSANAVDLTLRIDPGNQQEIKRVVVLGREYTRSGTIARELKLKDGDPLRQVDVLESQRQLFDLGVLSQVQIATEDPQSEEKRRTVLVGIEEAKRWTVGYGGGIEFQRLASDDPQGEFKVSPRVTLEISRLNVGGRAQTLSLRGRFSTIEKGGAISYLIPRFPTRRDLSLLFTALADRSREVVTFTSKRREALISLEKRFSPAAFLAARYSIRKVEATDIQIGTEQSIPILSRPARVAMLSASYANDHRDEPTDATRGSYSVAEAGFSGKRLGSQSNFFRISGQNATYYRIAPHLVFARSTRVAVESTVGAVTRTGEIPLPERFFMGGSESHRGFSINQAGPRDPVQGFPLGGEALFFNSLELRVRLASDRLGVVLFQDAGNVFSQVQRMKLLKFTQNSPTDLDFNSLAAGLGVRYKTPVGPVRFDVGYNFNPPRYRVVIPDGTPEGLVEIRRLPRFQFFLGIGQSF